MVQFHVTDSDAPMADYASRRRFRRAEISPALPVTILLMGVSLLIVSDQKARGESPTKNILIRSDARASQDPAGSASIGSKPLHETKSAAPVDAAAYLRLRSQSLSQPVHFQTQLAAPANGAAQANVAANPCAELAETPLGALGINIAIPAGNSPTDVASACWVSINQTGVPFARERSWASSAYYWDATCLCHRPLYFEQINLERHGYGCCETLQPAASAAHFFATVPALPYLMTVDCPHECIYTLGHYRPGSCPPWCHHWPPCDPLAAAAEGGVLTGLIFLIP